MGQRRKCSQSVAHLVHEAPFPLLMAQYSQFNFVSEAQSHDHIQSDNCHAEISRIANWIAMDNGLASPASFSTNTDRHSH